MDYSPHRRAAATRKASDADVTSTSTTVAAADAVAPKGAVGSSRRSKRDVILSRHFKRREEDEKPLISEEPKVLNNVLDESDRSNLSLPAEQVDDDEAGAAAEPEGKAVAGQRQLPSRKMSPAPGKKLAVARLKKINSRSQEEKVEEFSGSTTPLLLAPATTTEPTPAVTKLSQTASDLRPRQVESASASAVASLMVKNAYHGSSVMGGTPARGTRRRELVLQRLSSTRKEAGSSPAGVRSVSPMTRQSGGIGEATDMSTKSQMRSNSLGRNTISRSDSGTQMSKATHPVATSGPAGAVPSALVDRRSPALGTTPPRLTRRSVSSPSPMTKVGRSSVDSDSEDDTKTTNFRPVQVAANGRNDSSPLMRVARERTHLHRSIRARARSRSVENMNAGGVSTESGGSSHAAKDTRRTMEVDSEGEDAVQGNCSGVVPAQPTDLDDNNEDKIGESDAEMGFISGFTNGSEVQGASVEADDEKNQGASASSIDDGPSDGPRRWEPPPRPPRARVDSPSDSRSASSAETTKSESVSSDNANGNPPSHEEDQPVDSSWDSNHVYFGRFSEEVKKAQGDGALNMFDTESWVRTEVSFQSASLHMLRDDSKSLEEKKESDPNADLLVREKEITASGPDHTPLHLHVFTTELAHLDDVKSEISRSEAGLTDILGDYDVSVVSRSSKLLSMISLDPEPAAKDTNLVVATSPAKLGSESLVEPSKSEMWVPGTPPPPPPPGTPNKRKNRRTPRKIEHPSPGARSATTPAATPRASGSKKSRFFADDALPRAQDQDTTASPPSRLDSTTKSVAESGANPDSAPPALGLQSSRNLSAVSSAAVIQDSKLAEKVDLAISVAASKFEEQVEKAASAESIHAASHEDATIGAFASWNVLPTSAELDGDREPPISSNSDPIGFDASIPSFAARATKKPVQKESGLHSDSGRRLVYPFGNPSPFEEALERAPQVLSTILSFLGDPVAVCRVKMTSKACLQYVEENEHRLMRDAVRLGGMSMNVRPSFWLWVTLQKSNHLSTGYVSDTPRAAFDSVPGLVELVRNGRVGKWHHVIERDVERAFGNLPPHKTGARLRTDSIVRALVTWGKNRIMKRGLKGSGPPPVPSAGNSIDSDDVSLAPTDTVSDWGGVTPAGSFTSSMSDAETRNDKAALRDRHPRRPKKTYQGELALSGNALTEDMKASLQAKLSFILHALASAHGDVGYCQGMDYVVAHLLRILQDTVRWSAATGKLPSAILSAPGAFYTADMSAQQRLDVYKDIDRSFVVEEACFRVMDSFFSVYNLRHFYWPELRCLKTCCLVFERLIKTKLPVLADHFEHHELNVGLFALGWFQTLFLYLPSMPSATVCHMWDIWLVERSFKIFFRVGTAILFLSQPILLNHELEGMMSYLNTFPDATLLSPDILIACALQIKVTNRMLMELEREVTNSSHKATTT